MSIYRAHFGTCGQRVLPVRRLFYEICCLVSMGRPFWREDGSAICSVITQWSESRRNRNLTLLSHLRLPQPGGPGSRIYIPQEQGGPVMPLGTGFPLCRLLRLVSDGLQGYGGVQVKQSKPVTWPCRREITRKMYNYNCDKTHTDLKLR
jgi:hypothetical protein